MKEKGIAGQGKVKTIIFEEKKNNVKLLKNIKKKTKKYPWFYE